MERGTRARLACAALIACIACASLIACASSSGSERPDSDSYVTLPPESWPSECPLVFVDSSGNPIHGTVKGSSVRLLAFGQKAALRNVKIEEDGSVSASSIVFDASKDRKGGKLSLPEPRLRPLEGEPTGAVIEYQTPDGWGVGIEGFEASDEGSAFRGRLRSRTEARTPGETASSSARFSGLLLGGKAQADWTKTVVTDVQVLVDMEAGEDLLSAQAAALSLDSGSVSLSCELRLSGGAALAGASEPGFLDFPLSLISGGGKISLPGVAPGPAGFRLSGGFAVSLTQASFSKGNFICAGTLFFPAEWKSSAPLSLPEGAITVRGIRALSLSTAESPALIEFSAFGTRLAASGLSLVHSGKAKVSIKDAAIVAIGSQRREGSDFRVPLGALEMEDGVMFPGEIGLPNPIRLPGFAASFDLAWVGWGPGGFRFRGKALLPGFLGASDMELPDLAPGSEGELAQAEEPESGSHRFLGSPYSIRGLRLLPGGSVKLDTLAPSGDGRAGLNARNLIVGADGTLFPDFEATVRKLAGESDFAVTGISSRKEGGIRLAGGMTVSFASEGIIFSGKLETSELRISVNGEYGIGEYRWLKEKVPAFLGLVFRKAEFAFRNSQAFLVLSDGTFAGRGAWPSGGEMHGLGLNLVSGKYDTSALRFPEPAILTKPEGVYILTSFLSALDDVYLFSGTAELKALPGAPWEDSEVLKVVLMRLDAYGNVRELRLVRNGQELDGKTWIKDK